MQCERKNVPLLISVQVWYWKATNRFLSHSLFRTVAKLKWFLVGTQVVISWR